MHASEATWGKMEKYEYKWSPGVCNKHEEHIATGETILED